MDGIPPPLKTDSEDVVWALQTAESLWKRSERVDAIVWLRRAAQAAGEGDDAKRAAQLAKHAAGLSDIVARSAGKSKPKGPPALRTQSLEELDRMLGGGALGDDPVESDAVAVASGDVEVMSAREFEAGFGAPRPPAGETDEEEAPASAPSDSEVMTVSIHAPDIEVIEEGNVEAFTEEEPTPVRRPYPSPAPARPPADARSENDPHAGMLDPWAESDLGRRATGAARGAKRNTFEDEEVVTSAKARPAQLPPTSGDGAAIVPPAPKAPRIPVPKTGAKKPPPEEDETDTTTYKQINPRSARAGRPPERSEPSIEPPPAPSPTAEAKRPGKAPAKPPAFPPAVPRAIANPAPAARPPSARPVSDLLEMVDSVIATAPDSTAGSTPPTARPPTASVPASARPTAPPPGSLPDGAIPSSPPTRPRAGSTLLDLSSVEALSDLPDDAREAFAIAATTHELAKDEEVSHFALALVVDGAIDVSAQIVDAAALRLEKNAILRSRGTLTPGLSLRLVCASDKATIATWDDAAVANAFRTCPWVEEDLRAVADAVQAKAGVTMGPLGERFDMSLRGHLTSKLNVRTLAPGEVLVAQAKPVPIAIVGVGEIVLTKKDGSVEATLGPGDFVFPSQILAHGAAPATATAGPGGAIVLYGDRAVSQELLMSFPPLLEVLASI